jgi:hypothetical protein
MKVADIPNRSDRGNQTLIEAGKLNQRLQLPLSLRIMEQLILKTRHLLFGGIILLTSSKNN